MSTRLDVSLRTRKGVSTGRPTSSTLWDGRSKTLRHQGKEWNRVTLTKEPIRRLLVVYEREWVGTAATRQALFEL